jgi:DNA-binding NarL/FixJ family response regulator
LAAPYKFLIIDDSRVSRMKIRAMLQERLPDSTFLEAGTGEEGLDLARAEHPSLITIDINMPGMGGLAAAERLRIVSPDSKLVLLSANIQDSVRQRAENLAISFVEKPINEATINKILTLLD